MSALQVLVDGVPLAAEAAVELWKKFSLWMDAHPGDLAGFASAEGFASVHPELRGGLPVLVVSRTAPQGPYTSAPSRPSAGERGPGAGARAAPPSSKGRKGPGRKRR